MYEIVVLMDTSVYFSLEFFWFSFSFLMQSILTRPAKMVIPEKNKLVAATVVSDVVVDENSVEVPDCELFD